MMEKIRKLIKDAKGNTLLEMWKESKEDMSNEAIAVTAIIETELEKRGLIKLNEETFEYEIA